MAEGVRFELTILQRAYVPNELPMKMTSLEAKSRGKRSLAEPSHNAGA
jgi:hypothetical protein